MSNWQKTNRVRRRQYDEAIPFRDILLQPDKKTEIVKEINSVGEAGYDIMYIDVDLIASNRNQPRKIFSLEELSELAESIRQFGVIQPLTVRKNDVAGYDLIAGERRLRAAKMAELSHVPCVLIEADERKSAYIALVENLQRKDLDCYEEAHGFANLIRRFGITQEEAASRVGKSQSSIANKIRLLKLGNECIERLRAAGMGERYGRALLRLADDETRMRMIDIIIEKDMTVAQTEQCVEKLLAGANIDSFANIKRKAKRKRTMVVRDVRLFLNSVDSAFRLMKSSGIHAEMERVEQDECLRIVIKLPKGQTEPAGK